MSFIRFLKTGYASETSDTKIMGEDNPLPTNPGALSSEYDSVDVSKMSKGSITTVHNAISAPALSNAVDITGYNAILLDFYVTAYTSGTLDVQIHGAVDGEGVYGQCFIGTLGHNQTFMQHSITGGVKRQIVIFRGLPDSIKVDVSGTFVATATLTVQPLNV